MGSGINNKKWDGVRDHSTWIWEYKAWDRDQQYDKRIRDPVIRQNIRDHKILKCALIGGTKSCYITRQPSQLQSRYKIVSDFGKPTRSSFFFCQCVQYRNFSSSLTPYPMIQLYKYYITSLLLQGSAMFPKKMRVKGRDDARTSTRGRLSFYNQGHNFLKKFQKIQETRLVVCWFDRFVWTYSKHSHIRTQDFGGQAD